MAIWNMGNVLHAIQTLCNIVLPHGRNPRDVWSVGNLFQTQALPNIREATQVRDPIKCLECGIFFNSKLHLYSQVPLRAEML